MKSILLSIKPQYVAKILNGEKTIEIRKKFPKDYVGWVYIYVTQNHKHAGWKNRDTLKRDSHDGKPTNHFQLWTDDMVEDKDKINGKVIARFWCDKVECAYNFYTEELCQLACISKEELCKYAGGWYKTDDLLAIHITEVKPFDKPKEISEFKYYKKFSKIDYMLPIPRKETCERLVALTRAPQSFMFIEV